MLEKCAQCLMNPQKETCKKIPDEHLVYTDMTKAEEQENARHGIHRTAGAPAQRARCMLRMLGAQRIQTIAELMQKYR